MQFLRSLRAKPAPNGATVFDAEIVTGLNVVVASVSGLRLEDFTSYERFRLKAAMQGIAIDLDSIRGCHSVRKDRWWDSVATAIRQGQADARAASAAQPSPTPG